MDGSADGSGDDLDFADNSGSADDSIDSSLDELGSLDGSVDSFADDSGDDLGSADDFGSEASSGASGEGGGGYWSDSDY